MPTYDVKVEGLEKLQRKLGRTLDAVKPMLDDAGKYAIKEAVDILEGRPGATGRLAQATKSELAPGAIPLHARVFHATPISEDVEIGRPAGRPQPPIAAMERWAGRAGIDVPPFVLAKQIKERGTKGVFFMKQAAEAVGKKMPELARQAVAKIESMWGSR
jgi:hypothetical protein